MVRYGLKVESPEFEENKKKRLRKGVRFFGGQTGASIPEMLLSTIAIIVKNQYDDVLGVDFLEHLENLAAEGLEKKELHHDIDYWNDIIEPFGLEVFTYPEKR